MNAFCPSELSIKDETDSSLFDILNTKFKDNVNGIHLSKLEK